MKIIDLLKKSSIKLGESPASKEDLIGKLVDLMETSGNLKDKEIYKKDVLLREKSGTTGIGEGIAIPHAKSAGVDFPQLAAMTIPQGTDYESLDGEDTKLFFLIAVPEKSSDEHIILLQRLSTMLMDQSFREDLLNAKNEDEFLTIIANKEKEKFPDDFVKNTENTLKGSYDLLAVTGCPTGVYK